MVALLAAEKKRLLAEKGHVTLCDFRAAYERCWHEMVLERAWAHNTPIRRSTRISMLCTRPEVRAAFLEVPSAFGFAHGRIYNAADGMCLRLETRQTPYAILAAIQYVEIMDRRQLMELAA